MNRISILLILFLFFVKFSLPVVAQDTPVTGLSDWTLFLDPGHAQKENMGLYNYSEAEKVLRVAWALRDMLEEQTDIAEVYLSRLTDTDQISLAGRTDLANALGADFYYSIHSDAGSPSANSTLMLYGGWRSEGQTVEKSPPGGAALGEILNLDLSGAMRIPTRGNWADRNFYLGTPDHHENQWPYLHVNRTTNMASLLSEAGFHTNPKQQQLNINAESKALEALVAFRSILELHGIDRPAIGVATGIITDLETEQALNDVLVSIGDKQYVTDGYASLFHKYSNDPEELQNGFYWLDGLDVGTQVEVVFSADGYEEKHVMLNIVSNPNGRTHENLSFLDVQLTSLAPPVVLHVNASESLEVFIPGTALEFVFSRIMDRESVENAIGLSDASVDMTYTWLDDFRLAIEFEGLAFVTEYTLLIDGSIAKNLITSQFLDGDGDGTEGGNYELVFTTAEEDTQAPELLDFSPEPDAIVNEFRPLIRLVYDEEIVATSIASDAVTLKLISDGTLVDGQIHHMVVDRKSVIHFFPLVDLNPETTYEVEIAEGLADIYGNATESFSFSFVLDDVESYDITVIDAFDGTISEWWSPQASGSTTGIVTEETGRVFDGTVANLSVGSSGSLRLNYGWDINAPAPYIRLYLPPTALQNTNVFNKEDFLQVFVFGDGSNTEFRFMIRDGNSTYEASSWYAVDWIGWKLVSWDLTNDPVFAWVNGNGVLDGVNFKMDGIHFRYVEGGAQKGALYLDQLRFLSKGASTLIPTPLSKGSVSVSPNPVTHAFRIHSDELIHDVKIYSLTGQLMKVEMAGEREKTVNVNGFPAGVYIVRVVTDGGLSHIKIQVVK